MQKWLLAAIGAVTLLPLLTPPAEAQERRREERRFEERFRDRDIRRFHNRDIEVWRRGGWVHGTHNGRFGWWWVSNGAWYNYPAPVYPYPDPYVPPLVAAPAPAPVPGGQVWYYCRNPAGYYPYVPTCRVPWRAVPAG